MSDESKPEDKSLDKAPESKVTPEAQEKSTLSESSDEDDLKGLPDEWRKKVKDLRLENSRRRDDTKAAKEEAKAAREEAASLKKLKEDEELEKKKKNGEWEEIAKQKDQALQKANERTMRAELRLYAQRAGILDPSDVNNLSLEGLTLDESGEVHGAEKAIKKLQSDKPHWFKAAEDKTGEPPKSTSSKVIEPPAGKPDKKELSDLTDAEYETEKKNFFANLRSKR